MTKQETLLAGQLATLQQSYQRLTERLDALERYLHIRRIQKTGPPNRTSYYKPERREQRLVNRKPKSK